MRRNLRTVLTSFLAVVAFSLAAAGCGGSGGNSPSVASVGSATSATTTTNPDNLSTMVAFSQCMRSHGVPNFPDPQNFAGGSVKLTIHSLQPSQASMNACGHLLPTKGGPPESAGQRRRQLADELSFARCMRGRGVTNFPDPTGQGQLTVAMVEAQGIDVHSPTVLRVVQACIPASHGGLTMAKVRDALNNAGH